MLTRIVQPKISRVARPHRPADSFTTVASFAMSSQCRLWGQWGHDTDANGFGHQVIVNEPDGPAIAMTTPGAKQL